MNTGLVGRDYLRYCKSLWGSKSIGTQDHVVQKKQKTMAYANQPRQNLVIYTISIALSHLLYSIIYVRAWTMNFEQDSSSIDVYV